MAFSNCGHQSCSAVLQSINCHLLEIQCYIVIDKYAVYDDIIYHVSVGDQGLSGLFKLLLMNTWGYERTYSFDVLDGVISRHREFEEDPSWQQEVHHDLLDALRLPFLLHPILPRGHGDGLSFTVSSSAAHWKTQAGSVHTEETQPGLICPLLKCVTVHVGVRCVTWCDTIFLCLFLEL